MSGQHYPTKLKVCQKSRNISIGNNTINQVQYNQMLKGYNKLSQELYFSTNSSDISQVISDVFPN